MKNGPFKIYIDRLKNDDTETIHEIVDSDFLQEGEKEPLFIGKVTVTGQAYLANHHLILELKIKATATLPCSICNEIVEIPIEIDDFTQTVEISEIRASIYDFAQDVRDSVLLKLPQFVECHHGHCPQRKDINKYLKKPSEDTYSPFSDLSL
ncbi:MAG: hypothetical protein JSS30_05580 [Verrucomicrobia bacterium]|nr:hypothetical protein [Verrucomicrobiota bacterium]